MNLTNGVRPERHASPECPHSGRAPTVRSGGLILTAFGTSIAVDRAMVGTATTTQQTRVTLGALAAGVGLVFAAGAQLRGHTCRGEPATARRISQALVAAALCMVVVRGLPQLGDLIDHVQADRDEPTTTLVYVARLAVTGTLTAALAVTARRSR